MQNIEQTVTDRLQRHRQDTTVVRFAGDHKSQIFCGAFLSKRTCCSKKKKKKSCKSCQQKPFIFQKLSTKCKTLRVHTPSTPRPDGFFVVQNKSIESTHYIDLLTSKAFATVASSSVVGERKFPSSEQLLNSLQLLRCLTDMRSNRAVTCTLIVNLLRDGIGAISTAGVASAAAPSANSTFCGASCNA